MEVGIVMLIFILGVGVGIWVGDVIDDNNVKKVEEKNEQLNKEVAQLTTQTGDLRQIAAHFEQEFNSLNEHSRNQADIISHKNKQLRVSEAALSEVKKQVKEKEAKLRGLNADVASLEKQIKDKNAQLYKVNATNAGLIQQQECTEDDARAALDRVLTVVKEQIDEFDRIPDANSPSTYDSHGCYADEVVDKSPLGVG